MATKNTPADEAAQIEAFTAQLTQAVQAATKEAVEPLVQRIAALETALEGARAAYKDLRSQITARREPAKRAAPRVNYWGKACVQLRQERGLVAAAWLPEDDIRARMKELAEIDAIYARDARDQATLKYDGAGTLVP